MFGIDTPLLLLMGLAIMGVVSKNETVAIAMLVLAIMRLTHMNKAFPYLEKFGITVGVIILTIAVMSPIASGKIGVTDVFRTFTHWQSLLAIGIGIFVSYLGGRGVAMMSGQPLIVTGLLVGTIIGVAIFKGVPVGPLIAAGMLALVLGYKS